VLNSNSNSLLSYYRFKPLTVQSPACKSQYTIPRPRIDFHVIRAERDVTRSALPTLIGSPCSRPSQLCYSVIPGLYYLYCSWLASLKCSNRPLWISHLATCCARSGLSSSSIIVVPPRHCLLARSALQCRRMCSTVSAPVKSLLLTRLDTNKINTYLSFRFIIIDLL
jgi:hypothetical protein